MHSIVTLPESPEAFIYNPLKRDVQNQELERKGVSDGLELPEPAIAAMMAIP